MERKSAARVAAQLDQLRRLARAPAEQAALAARLLTTERNAEVLLAALAMLTDRPDPAWRSALLTAYAYHETNPARRDPGGTIRGAILKALRPVTRAEDAPLLERAASTHEFLFGEAAGDLRAAALLALNQLDDRLAGYHAIRLLGDYQYTSIMSGEPAVTAARVLAAQRQVLPLYAYVSRPEDGAGDVVAECLRGLTELPPSLLPALVERYLPSTDEIVLLGLFDLLLAHPSRPTYLPAILDFLRATALDGIYRSLVMTLVAGGDATAIDALTAMEASESNQRKVDLLRSALALRQPPARRAPAKK